LSGTLFIPVHVEAGLLSSLFGPGDQVYAEDTVPPPKPSTPSDNSQNITLLESNVSPAAVFNDKNSNKDANTIPTSTDTSNIVSDNALLSATGPMGVSDGKDVVDPASEESSVYVVRKGDSISQIADMFGVSADTILAANNLKKGSKLVEGDVLFILPFSGIEHTVTKGQTLKSIAKLYKVDISDITQFNGITEDAKLAVGDKIMIPGGEMIDEGGDKPAPNLASSAAKDANYYATHLIQNIVGYFVNPVPDYKRKSQGLHGPGNRGIDLAAPKGTHIYAAAAGEVLLARGGYNGGYGNMVIIQHPNGTKTLYGHMSKLATRTGTEVAQGELIGYVGSTGHSTGPHLHFEVFNARNPGADWSWAK